MRLRRSEAWNCMPCTMYTTAPSAGHACICMRAARHLRSLFFVRRPGSVGGRLLPGLGDASEMVRASVVGSLSSEQKACLSRQSTFTSARKAEKAPPTKQEQEQLKYQALLAKIQENPRLFAIHERYVQRVTGTDETSSVPVTAMEEALATSMDVINIIGDTVSVRDPEPPDYPGESVLEQLQKASVMLLKGQSPPPSPTQRGGEESKIGAAANPSAPAPPSMRSSLPSGLLLRGTHEVISVAERFDNEHRKRTAAAYKGLREQLHRGPDPTKSAEYANLLQSMKLHRVSMPASALEHPWSPPGRKLAFDVQRRAPKTTYQPQQGMWKQRASWSDSRSLYDTVETHQRAFSVDWERALKSFNLIQHILRNCYGRLHEDPGAWKDIDDDRIIAVGDVLRDYLPLIYGTFDVYCSESYDDILCMNHNAFSLFVEQCELCIEGSGAGDSVHYDELFRSMSDTSRCEGEAEDNSTDEPRVLRRHTWIQCLVRIAIIRHLLCGDIADVSLAVEKLIVDDLAPKLDACCHESQDEFRHHNVYTEYVDAVLWERREFLAHIFDSYATASTDIALSAIGPTKLLRLPEWIAMLSDLAVLDDEFTEREAKKAYLLSRMRVVDEFDAASAIKLEGLSLEDMYEALVRAATIKQLPTDAEIQEAGHLDGGDFLCAEPRSSNQSPYISRASAHVARAIMHRSFFVVLLRTDSRCVMTA